MELAKEEINGYEYVRNIDDIKVGNKVKYLTKRYFFNMKLSEEMIVTSKSRFYQDILDYILIDVKYLSLTFLNK